jgi:hypothetical protein
MRPMKPIKPPHGRAPIKQTLLNPRRLLKRVPKRGSLELAGQKLITFFSTVVHAVAQCRLPRCSTPSTARRNYSQLFTPRSMGARASERLVCRALLFGWLS